MSQLPFIPNQVYHRRNEIHSVYGGNWQGGICPSSNYPYIFIFTGKSGQQHGYEDGWDNDYIFSYTGEGQSGDMRFIRGNLALKEHVKNGKRVFLFKFEKRGYVRFISELELFDIDYFETIDTQGDLRTGIKFFFSKAGSYVPVKPEELNKSSIVAEPESIYATPPSITERSGLVTSRVGQGAYRKRIIHRWNYKCAVTGYDKLDILIASHIVPWADASNNERLDVNNGLLLSPTYDALFDRHLISFENSGKIILSDTIQRSAFEKIGISGKEKINDLNSFNKDYLESHRNKYLEINH